jgi:cytochrome c oxidase subunit 2
MELLQVMPERASTFADGIDTLYLVILGMATFFAVLVIIAVIYFAVKYRAGSKADRSHPHNHNLKLELAWSIIPLLMTFPIFYYAAKMFVEMYTPLNIKNSLNISVVGKQWMWQLQHPTGQRENNELHVPVGRYVKLTMISQDVIHSFFVPAFRIKRDVLPGRYVSQWFKATKTGKFHLFCAEYCGTKHSEMTGTVYVMEPADYEKWLSQTQWGTKPLKETMAQAGERLYYERKCDSCHDQGREKVVAPSLAALFGKERTLTDGRTVVADEEYLRRSIYEPDTQKVSGFEPVMPSFKGILDEQQVLQLIEYIKSLQTPELGRKTEGRNEH